jgi:hypothetical protein
VVARLKDERVGREAAARSETAEKTHAA